MRHTAFGPVDAPAPSRRGRPILLTAGDWKLDSADNPDQVPAIRRWMQDRLFAGSLGRTATDPGDAMAANFVMRFDRLAHHLFMIRRADGAPDGVAMVHIDVSNRLCWLEIAIGERKGGDTQTALTEVAFALATWVFETLGLDKINVQVAEDNGRTASWAARRMTLEARLRDEVRLPDGRRRTILRYGLLRSEWEAVKRRRSDRIANGGRAEEPRRSFEERRARPD